ncbi:molybdate ABC transporter substrate-binding protein [Pseudophaeobacter flagellatus]|uniref:molybdate ABC transporter substrate-binding protein n=1 Tax=Pseudophaeobacter flagellatus TaxID=2899119 RepID=UPI002FCB0D55
MSRITRFLTAAAWPGLLALAVMLGAAGSLRAADVTLFAAASLKNALDEISQSFEAETGYSLAISLAGSSILARQISLGAPADIYLPASPDWMDYLQAKGHVLPNSRRNLLGNHLVLVAPRDSGQPISGFDDPGLMAQLGQGKLAMALVQAVPAGIYGKSALQWLGLWQRLAPQVAQADNVRAALALVAAGAAPLGVVYASDARAEPRVMILAEFPSQSHAPIRYPLALIRPVANAETAPSPAAASLYAYLQGPVARAAFLEAGFDVDVE